MIVNEETRMTVAFVCAKRTDGTFSQYGTAFFVGHHSTQSHKLKTYVVTALHVIEGIRDQLSLDTVYLRYNGLTGIEELPIALSNWYTHEGDEGEYMDVAVARLPEGFFELPPGPHAVNPLKVRYWLSRHLVSILTGDQAHLRLGHEIGITGLFVHHTGSAFNIPIVRCGTIAALPGEPIRTRRGPLKGLLIELRSVGGLSGSPVFTSVNGQVYLIGLIHGHFDNRDSDIDALINEDSPSSVERINAGIGIVVPSDRIREAIWPLIKADFPGEVEATESP
jgi:hypothetical protein